MLPGPAIMFALGLYDVAAWGRSLLNDVLKIYSSSARDRNNISWSGLALVAL